MYYKRKLKKLTVTTQSKLDLKTNKHIKKVLNLINMQISQLKVTLKKLTQHLSASFVNSATLTLTNTK